jgi:hypothetical protein
VERVDHFIKVVTTNNKDPKVSAARTLQVAVESVRAILDHADCPEWVDPIIQACNHAVANNGDGSTLVNLLTTLMLRIKDIRSWGFIEHDTHLDFDAIFRAAYDKSQIPELFDKTGELLQQIVESGHCDSIKVREMLEGLIALLKKNRNGSYYSAAATWQVMKTAFSSALFHTLTTIPLLGVALKTLSVVLKELDLKWSDLGQEITETIQSKLTFDVKGIGFAPSARLVGPTAADVIDAEFETKAEPKAAESK